MSFKSFRIQSAFRIILLTATIVLLVLTFTFLPYSIPLGALVLFQVYSLFHYVERTNRDLTRFIEAIRHSDFTQAFSGENRGFSFKSLSNAFNEVMGEFKRERMEKEQYAQYLQTIVLHVGVGLVAFQKNGDVDLINNAAKRLLGVRSLRSILNLEAVSNQLVKVLFNIQPGENALVKIEPNGMNSGIPRHLSLRAAAFRMQERDYTLVSFHDILHELEDREIDAWQNLIRVLTHEIMNSVTPIVSLSSTAHGILTDNKGNVRNQENVLFLAEVRGALETIHKRGQGLLHFVEAYRSLTKLPKPDFKAFPILRLFDRVEQLLHEKLSVGTIVLEKDIDPIYLELSADAALVEQVLINLMLNAIDALEGITQPKITLRGKLDERSRVSIQIMDNGQGIPDDLQDKIFIPFFTTKQKGSGVGLSLSREIMRLHGGGISLYSKAGQGAVFTLRF